MSNSFSSHSNRHQAGRIGAVLVAGALSWQGVSPVEARPLPAYAQMVDVRAASTLEGTVTQMREGGRFDIALDGGGTVTVQTDRTQSGVRLAPGFRVRVYGEENGRLFRARTIQVLEDNDSSDGSVTQEVDLRGTVVNVRSNRRFMFRDDRGRRYTVDSDEILPNLQGVTRVRVIGTLRRQRIDANRVTILNDNGNSGNNGGELGRRVNFEATVYRRLSDTRIRVRAHNGTASEVQTSFGMNDIQVNDRVRIRGRMNGNVIMADQVTRLGSTTVERPQTRRPKPIGRIAFNGVISSVNDSARQLIIRGDRGGVFTVEYLAARNFTRGQHVAVTGTLYAGNSVVANRVSLLKTLR